MKVDFGRTADDYSRHRAGFPEKLFERLADFGLGKEGQVVLDLATGTGALARGLARRGASVTGLDISADMLAAAASLAEAEGLPLTIREGKAEETGLPERTYDGVTAGQCWHWFDSPATAREVWRLLKPGGLVAICHFDWIRLPGNLVDATLGLIESYNPDWNMGRNNGFHPEPAADLSVAGFADIASFSFDQDVSYSHEAWRGRIRASAGVGGSLAPQSVGAFDAAHAALLADCFPRDPMLVPHRCFALLARKPAPKAA